MNILSAAPSSDLFLGNTGEDRAPGLHLSDILSRMAWDRDRKYNPAAPKDLMIFEAGHTWETVLSRALAERHKDRAGYRPEPFREDGIWLSPDWVNPDADVQAEEWKATRKSIMKADEKVQEWFPQVKSYLRALLKRGLATAPVVRFRVWFIMGDWSFENKGDLTLLRDYYTIDAEFTKRELEENWQSIVTYARRFGLLKDNSWHSSTETKARATAPTIVRKKPASSRPRRSSAKGQVVTFPPSRTPSRSRSV